MAGRCRTARPPTPRKPVEPGERVPTGFTGLLGGLKDEDEEEEDEDPLAWLTTPNLDQDEDEDEAAFSVEAASDDEELGSTSWLRNSVAGDELDAETELDSEDSPEDDLAWLGLADDDALPDTLVDAVAETGADQDAPPDPDDPLAWLYTEDAALDEADFEVSIEPSDTRSGDDPLSWLRAEAETEEEPAMTSPPESGPDRPEAWEQPEDDAENWLSALGGSDETPGDDDALDENVPDWLSQAAPEAPSGAASADDDQDEEEDWLAAISLGAEASPGEDAEEDVPDWLGQMSTPAEEAPAAESDDGEDWLSRLGELGTQEPEISEPDFLFGAGEESEPAEEAAPAWLGTIGQNEEPAEEAEVDADLSAESAPQAEPEVGEGMRLNLADTPDWLDALGDTEEAAPAAPAAPEAGPSAPTGVTNWLNAIQPEDEGESSGLVPEDTEAWKGLLGEEEPAAELEIEESEDEVPDWLSAPPAPTEEAPDWLSDLGALGEEAPAAEETPAEVAPAAEGLPDWLSAMQPSDEEEPAAEELPAAEETRTKRNPICWALTSLPRPKKPPLRKASPTG